MAADVVDDLDSGFDGVASGGCVEGVDGEDGFGALFEDGFDDGEDAGLLLVGCERGGVGAGGFAANIDDAGALVEHLEGLGEGSFGGVLGGVEVAAVGEGVGRYVEDAHDEGAMAERECAGSEVPVEVWAWGEGHGGILVFRGSGFRQRVGMLDCADDEALFARCLCVDRGGVLWAAGFGSE